LGGTGTLTAKQVQDITNGITSWNGVNGITFNVTSGAGATPPPGSAYSYKVSVGTTSDPDSNGGETTITGAGQGCGGNCSNNDTTIIQYTQSNLANDAVLQQIAAHETGHTIGLGDVLPCNSNSVMSAALNCDSNTGPTACDKNAAKTAGYSYPANSPPPGGTPPNPPPPPPTCGSGTCTNCIPPACWGGAAWNPTLCECYLYGTPIIIDTDDSGFHLTSAEEGVRFDFFGTGHPVQIAWTAPGSTNGWLALNRDGKGITSGKDLFGNLTPQPQSPDPNGFLALAVYDQHDHGGNSDGFIDSGDAVWPDLVVWIDANHDGVSQPEELHPLDEVGIHSIALSYSQSQFTDQFGNQFRYKGRLNPIPGDHVDRTVYDVILTQEDAPNATAWTPGIGLKFSLALQEPWQESVQMAHANSGSCGVRPSIP
jgi:hypothetical protein